MKKTMTELICKKKSCAPFCMRDGKRRRPSLPVLAVMLAFCMMLTAALAGCGASGGSEDGTDMSGAGKGDTITVLKANTAKVSMA